MAEVKTINKHPNGSKILVTMDGLLLWPDRYYGRTKMHYRDRKSAGTACFSYYGRIVTMAGLHCI
jgi:hypothetical protein